MTLIGFDCEFKLQRGHREPVVPVDATVAFVDPRAVHDDSMLTRSTALAVRSGQRELPAFTRTVYVMVVGHHTPVTDTQKCCRGPIRVCTNTPCPGKVLWARCKSMMRMTLQKMKGLNPWQLIVGLWIKRSVFVLDELEKDLLPASLSKCSGSDPMGLVHQTLE
ncbi:hypothetical protein JOB18_021787 [Solea senegalensis]|uniref:Uncharacterized protein n=1 Tax=Solea senegalensis TaxID=28829 RepID=A0AAV6PRK3_SOLSE|nr:hypothetical protein JOB18_021787 [Solea senegalensis]